jgi:hypothetical protein
MSFGKRARFGVLDGGPELALPVTVKDIQGTIGLGLSDDEKSSLQTAVACNSLWLLDGGDLYLL